MHVVATAGHVDHGKSALVEALTGTHPDRLAEERRRGLTIELGYCWTEWPEAGEIAFVDVPGHERFLTTMLAGVGPVPAVLLVVAADDPWMPQAAEHLAALDALGVRHAVVAVTRSDLADPAPAVARATGELARTGMAGAPVLAVSARTGAGLAEVRAAMAAMVAALPEPDPDADVRLWVDRRFSVRGAGTVVTGTLPAGTVRRGDSLALGDTVLRVREVQALGRDRDTVSGVARVALNLAGRTDDLARGSVLVTPGAWHHSRVVDVRLTGDSEPPTSPVLHVGAADVAVRCRPLGPGLARLTLDRPLPLRIGDRALLRDPGRRQVWRVDVLDPDPPRLRRRGAGARRAEQLASADGTPRLADELARRGVAHVDHLRRLGVPVPATGSGGHLAAGPWLVDRRVAQALADRLPGLVEEHARAHPLDPAPPLSVLASRLRLPAPELVRPLVRAPLRVVDGRVHGSAGAALPEAVRAAVDAVRRDLAAAPFAAPTADRLRDLGLDERALGAAERSGLLQRVGPGIVLAPDAAEEAVTLLRDLEQPFTTSAARERLGTTRRVALPLLDHLDRTGRTRRLPDDRREVV
ncbi:selenocysteine-specific translation elongation factor [Nocardioides sp. SYSU D00065]|uniref:selenocysteine-specific translation elongation factor n=1 Tax=Nocardioides sp. SYSU D00065 TaxID=2817378 RepID=UPI001B322ADF|nr:selenocysteine-specific translation elongation factor [Nocardioides sp. SYSU D00065]